MFSVSSQAFSVRVGRSYDCSLIMADVMSENFQATLCTGSLKCRLADPSRDNHTSKRTGTSGGSSSASETPQRADCQPE